MLKKRRLRAKDKLSVTEEISLDETADKATADEWLALVGPGAGGFEWKLDFAEWIRRPHEPSTGARPAEYSLPWYAWQIHLRIEAARVAFASNRLEELALHALEIGRLHEAGRWRHRVRALNQFARQLRAKNARGTPARTRRARQRQRTKPAGD